MKEKEIKEEKKELEVSEAQETEQQEQQAEAPAQEQKQEVQEKPEKAKKEHPVLNKVGAFGKKVGRGIKKAAPIAGAVIVGLGVGKLLGKVEAYNEVLGDSGNNDIPELPGETTETAEPVIEDAEFHEISTDEQSVE